SLQNSVLRKSIYSGCYNNTTLHLYLLQVVLKQGKRTGCVLYLKRKHKYSLQQKQLVKVSIYNFVIILLITTYLGIQCVWSKELEEFIVTVKKKMCIFIISQLKIQLRNIL